jgi:dephospho-CoA kinase
MLLSNAFFYAVERLSQVACMLTSLFQIYYFITGHWAVVLDIPLLFESGWERYCGTVMVVAVSDPEVQIKRLRERDAHLSEEDAKNRVMSQGDVRVKARHALSRGPARGVVVYNDGDRDDLKREVEKVMRGVKAGSPQWWASICLVCPPLGVTAAMWSVWRNWVLQREWKEIERKEKARL